MQDEDRQTQEAFEDFSSMSSIPEDRINRTPLSEEERRELLQDSARFIAEMTPVVGDVMSAKEVWEELQKDEPNYLLVGALAGATAIGLIPGIGDAAAQAIRTGARRGLDFARRVEVDPNALGSTGGNIRLRPEDQATPTRNLNITPPTPLDSLEELLDYNNRVRQPRSMLDRDQVRPGDNILYRPDRGYRAIGPEGYQDFLDSGFVRAVSGSKKEYETPYFMRGQSSSRYIRPEGEDYIVEAPLDTSWRGAANADDNYVGPGSNEAITRDSPIRVFRRNEDGSYSVVFDNIGDEALLPSGTSGFAEGGVVQMEEQMSLFEMGGLADDGAMRDPVSGNEVPPGSMASEVRDDVPSMLSEGEYVIPADVVRYYGVKFFEDLRMGAKSGLNEMEQTGRIGGEPVDSTPGDEPLSPEEMQMLAEISGMYGGGMVRRGYQEGGVVNKPFTPVPNYTTPGFSLFQPSQPAAPVQVPQTETVTLYGPNGEIATLTLPTDQERYNALIGQGYSTQQKVNQPTVQGGEGGGDSGAPEGVPTAPGLGSDAQRDFTPLDPDVYNALYEDPLKFGAEALKGKDFSKLLGGAGMALSPALGLLGGAAAAGMTAQNVAQARAASQIAKAKGLDTTALDTQITSYISGLPNLSRVSSDLLASGDKIAERFFQTARDISLPESQYGKNFLDRDFFAPGAAGDEAFAKEMQTTAPEGMVYQPETGSYERPDSESAAPTTSRVPTQRPDRSPGGGSTSTSTSGGDGKGFYESITGKEFKDTAVGKALGLGDKDSSSDSGGRSGGYSCYVATALTEKGYWSNTKRLKLIKWCMDTKPEDEFLTKLWRNGYVTFGKSFVAPFTSNKVVRWLADGYYESAVEGKKGVKALLGSVFFTVPSYSIGLVKAVAGKLVDIERT